MNAQLTTAVVTQSAAPELGMAEKKLYYLVVETAKGKMQINVGEKTHNQVKALTDVVTKIQIAEPEKGGKKS